MLRALGEKYSPLYFLAALGAGGMATLFFMGFMFITPHPATPIPTFESIAAAWASGKPGLQPMIVVAYTGLVAFVLLHVFLLVWNLREFAGFTKTAAYAKLRDSNAGVTLMAIPLTLAMTLNAMFVAGATLVPGLWSAIELLLPMALTVFVAIGVLALSIYGRFIARIFTGGFSLEANTGLNQLLGAFAFAMVGVGSAASAAMSTNVPTVTLGLIASIFFMVVSMLVVAVMLPLGMKSMLRHGLAPVNSATLWLPVPIITLWGITIVRDNHGLQTLHAHATGAEVVHGGSQPMMVMLAIAIAAQVAFLLFGHALMRRNGFYTDYLLTAKHQSPVAFTLVCPGVALAVLGFFGLHVGLVQNGIIEKFGLVYFAILAVLVAIIVVTIAGAVLLLKNQLFRAPAGTGDASAPASAPAVAPAQRAEPELAATR